MPTETDVPIYTDLANEAELDPLAEDSRDEGRAERVSAQITAAFRGEHTTE